MSAIFQYEVDEAKPMLKIAERSLISLEGITKTYDSGENEVQALRGVDAGIERGEFVSIIGPSGSGKSTLMHILGCLDSPSSGRYWLDGEDVAEMSSRALARIRNRQQEKANGTAQLVRPLSVNVCLNRHGQRRQADQHLMGPGRAEQQREHAQ